MNDTTWMLIAAFWAACGFLGGFSVGKARHHKWMIQSWTALGNIIRTESRLPDRDDYDRIFSRPF